MNTHPRNYPLFLLILLITLVSAACAEIRVSTIPPPAVSPRLRVYVEPFTTVAEGKRGESGWDTPHEEFVKNQIRLIEKYLAQTGIYEIVRREEVRSAIGDQKLSRYRMERNDWALARKIGGAVHADYVMILERGTNRLLHEKYFINVLINVETGGKFGVQYSFQRRGIRGQMKEIIHASYRDIFRSAKDDLFATAIKKGRGISSPSENTVSPEPAVAQVKQRGEGQQLDKKKPLDQLASENTTTTHPDASGVVPTIAPSTTAPFQKEQLRNLPVKKNVQKKNNQPQYKEPMLTAGAPVQSEEWLKEKDVEDALTQDQGVTTGIKLAVYDLDATEQYKPAALIFSEALREELFKLKKYTLVNREDLKQVLKEIALQQTGLIDEKEAVKTGKGLAANQVVTGKMVLLGKTFILQAKRINVETFATLGLASTKFSQGHEDEVFDKMPGFALRLTE